MSSRHDAHRRDWETLGSLDPLYAILSDDDHRGNAWDEERFFATGDADIGRLMEVCQRIGLPTHHGMALELGCGVGRLLRPLAAKFERCIGIDISLPMIERAKHLNAHLTNCEWIVNTRDDLAVIADQTADLTLSSLVLQHVPTRNGILRLLGELVRVTAQGGLLVVQLPDVLPVRQRIQPRRRAYGALRRVGIPETVLYNRLRLNPIRMSGVPRSVVEHCLREAGARILDIELGWLGDRAATGREVNLTYLATPERQAGSPT